MRNVVPATDEPLMNLQVKLYTFYVISFLAFISNVLLLVLAKHVKAKPLREYRYFFYAFAIIGMASATTGGTLAPNWGSKDDDFIFYTVGPLGNKVLGQPLLNIHCLNFIQTTVLITFSFIYRYLQMCRSNLLSKLCRGPYKTIPVVIHLLITGNWFLVVYIHFNPKIERTEHFETVIKEAYGEDIRGMAYMAVSLKDNFSLFYFLPNLVIVISILTSCIVYCARKILRRARNGSISNKTKRLYRQMLRLLMLQCLAPVCLCFLPILTLIFSISSGVDLPPAIMLIISLGLVSFPLLNPIIIIFYLKDYFYDRRKRTIASVNTAKSISKNKEGTARF